MKKIYNNSSTMIKKTAGLMNALKNYKDSEFTFFDYNPDLVYSPFTERFKKGGEYFLNKYGTSLVQGYLDTRRWAWNYLLGPYYTIIGSKQVYWTEPFDNRKDSFLGRYIKGVPFSNYKNSPVFKCQAECIADVFLRERNIRYDHFNKYTRDPRNWNSLTGIGDKTHNKAFNMGFEPIYAQITVVITNPDYLKVKLQSNTLFYKRPEMGKIKFINTIYPSKVEFGTNYIYGPGTEEFKAIYMEEITINGWYWDYDVVKHTVPVEWEEHKWSRKKKYYYSEIYQYAYNSYGGKEEWSHDIIPNTPTDNIPAEYDIWEVEGE